MANPRWRRLLGFLGSLIPSASWTKVRVSHEHIEVTYQASLASTAARISQANVEVVLQATGGPVRISHEALEVALQHLNGPVRICQECVEVVYSYVCEAVPPDAPPAPNPCSTDPSPDAGWAPGPCTGKFRGE